MKNYQVDLLKKIKFFFNSFNNDNYNPNKSSIFYLATYSNLIGSYILNSLANYKKLNFFTNTKIIIKDIFYSLRYTDFKYENLNYNFFYDKIIITWAFKENFQSDGSLNDRYFNINSKKLKKTLWVVLYMSKDLPKNINKNIFLIKRVHNIKINIFPILINLIKNIFLIFKDAKYYLASVSTDNYFSDIFLKQSKIFLNGEVKKVIMTYEGQVFQNKFINYIKKNYSKIKTIGYIHGAPMALPSNYVFKHGSPDKILINGKDQDFCFRKHLGWKKNSIKILPSFRFQKSDNKKKNIIFLPISLLNIRLVIDRLAFLHNKNFINLKNFTVKGHPVVLKEKKYIFLLKKFNSFISMLNKKNKPLYKGDYLIFVGAGGAIIEALERGSNIIQISEKPIFDVYSKKLYPTLIIKKIDSNIYTYKLKKKGNLIKFDNKKNNLKYIKSL